MVAFAGAATGPAAYTLNTVATPHLGSIPTAGPVSSQGGPGGGTRGGFGPGGTDRDGAGFPGGTPPQGMGQTRPGGGMGEAGSASTAVVQLLQADQGSYRWAAATTGSQGAATYQLASGQPVMAIGGFTGSDPSPTLAQFQAWVAAGDVHYFVAGGGFGGGRGGQRHVLGDLDLGHPALHGHHRRRRHGLRPHEARVLTGRPPPAPRSPSPPMPRQRTAMTDLLLDPRPAARPAQVPPAGPRRRHGRRGRAGLQRGGRAAPLGRTAARLPRRRAPVRVPRHHRRQREHRRHLDGGAGAGRRAGPRPRRPPRRQGPRPRPQGGLGGVRRAGPGVHGRRPVHRPAGAAAAGGAADLGALRPRDRDAALPVQPGGPRAQARDHLPQLQPAAAGRSVGVLLGRAVRVQGDPAARSPATCCPWSRTTTGSSTPSCS